MQQVMIYEYLGRDDDPVYKKISNLNKGETIVLDEMNLSLNSFGLYEISTENEHECFSDMMECYQFINDSLRDKLLGETDQEMW